MSSTWGMASRCWLGLGPPRETEPAGILGTPRVTLLIQANFREQDAGPGSLLLGCCLRPVGRYASSLAASCGLLFSWICPSSTNSLVTA